MTEQQAQPAPPNGIPQFYIPATSSLLERRPRTLKNDDTFAVFDHYGDLTQAPGSPEGLFHRDTRHLSRLELVLGGYRLLLLSSTLQDDNAMLTVDLTNADIYRNGRIALPRNQLHLRRSKYLWRGGCYERLALHNFDRRTHRFRLELRFGADFADLFEVRGITRERRGSLSVLRPSEDAVVLCYEGLDRVRRTTRLDFAPRPSVLGDDRASFDLVLAPGERVQLLVSVRCDDERPAERGAFFIGLRQARRAVRQAAASNAVVDTSNAMMNTVLCRAIADLHMLLSRTPQGLYPYAGIPWFSTAFGRDGIITALELLWFDPTIARGVLQYLAANQAQTDDPASEAEPGKILHETRHGEMAVLGEVPFRLYYGSVDATPLFVMLAGRYYTRTGDRATAAALWPHVEAALRWIDTKGDPDGDGFIEYHAREGKGLSNQGWKDSADSISHADGRLAEGPIALCEVQGYVYDAKRQAAVLARALGHIARAVALDTQAEQLRVRFEETFWCEELGTYALALDGAKRPCRVRSSNPGHLLFTGICSQERARRVMTTLLDRDSFCGWGVRTLAASERRYNPMSYHNGSVWPHDNALIAMGFARYGFGHAALKIFEALFDAIQYMDLLRPPELFCGFPRRNRMGPTLYPVACSPQAWASAAPLALIGACLGLSCVEVGREIRLERPMLPAFLDELRVRHITLGDAELDLLVRRHAGEVAVSVLERRGEAHVVVAVN